MEAYLKISRKMERKTCWMLELILILNVVHLSLQISYEFEIEDESIYSDCSDVPPGTLNISGLFDLTNYTTTITADGLSVSGNMTSVFNAQPTDRIEVLPRIISKPMFLINIFGFFFFFVIAVNWKPALFRSRCLATDHIEYDGAGFLCSYVRQKAALVHRLVLPRCE